MELPRISKNSVKENSERAETQLKSRKTVPVLFCLWFMQTDVYQWLCSHTKHQSMKHKLWPFTVQLLSRVWLFATPWTVACQASPSFTISLSLLKLTSTESVMPSNHLVLCCSLLPSTFPSIRVWVTGEGPSGPGRSEVKSLSRVWLFVTPWTVTYQATLTMGFSRQECWSGLPFPSAGGLLEPRSLVLQAVSCTAGRFFRDWATREAPHKCFLVISAERA